MKITQLITFSPIAGGGQQLAGLTDGGMVVIYDSSKRMWEKLIVNEAIKGTPLRNLPVKTVILNSLVNAGYETIEEVVQEFVLHGVNNLSKVSGLGYFRLCELQEAIEKLESTK